MADPLGQKPGVVYLSRIPPTMALHELRGYFEPFGKVGRIYLAPGEAAGAGKEAKAGQRDRKRPRFVEGWIEFSKRKDAKTAAMALNGASIGGKKSNRFHDDIWCVKYLKGFLWNNLTEGATYERAVRQHKLRAEISQARRINNQYAKQSERAREMEKIAEKRAAKQAKDGLPGAQLTSKDRLRAQMAALKKEFRQRQPITGHR